MQARSSQSPSFEWPRSIVLHEPHGQRLCVEGLIQEKALSKGFLSTQPLNTVFFPMAIGVHVLKSGASGFSIRYFSKKKACETKAAAWGKSRRLPNTAAAARSLASGGSLSSWSSADIESTARSLAALPSKLLLPRWPSCTSLIREERE